MSEPKLLDDAVSAAATGGGMGAAFFVLRWLWMAVTGRLDRREARIDAQDEKLDMEWQAIREEMKGRLDKIERQNEALRYAFHHVAGALIRLDPQNPALAQAEQMLAAAFPVDFRLLAEQAGAALDKNAGGET